MQTAVSHDTKIREAAKAWGASLVGVADTSRLAGIETQPESLLEDYPRAVVVGVQLSGGIMDGIQGEPTPLYAQHYKRVNGLLDDIATRLACLMQSEGARALPIPASQILCETRFFSYISHKAVAIAAGLGWQGKSLLLVTPKYGPRVRLVSVLTDLDLTPGEPLKNRCGSCTACSDACPGGAIRNVNTDLHYESREEAVDLQSCVAQLKRNEKLEHIPPYLCGVCVSVCPWGRRKKRR